MKGEREGESLEKLCRLVMHNFIQNIHNTNFSNVMCLKQNVMYPEVEFVMYFMEHYDFCLTNLFV